MAWADQRLRSDAHAIDGVTRLLGPPAPAPAHGLGVSNRRADDERALLVGLDVIEPAYDDQQDILNDVFDVSSR